MSLNLFFLFLSSMNFNFKNKYWKLNVLLSLCQSIINTIIKFTLVIDRKWSIASISSVFVNCCIIITICCTISITILSEFYHICLNCSCCAEWFIDAVRICCKYISNKIQSNSLFFHILLYVNFSRNSRLEYLQHDLYQICLHLIKYSMLHYRLQFLAFLHFVLVFQHHSNKPK